MVLRKRNLNSFVPVVAVEVSHHRMIEIVSVFTGKLCSADNVIFHGISAHETLPSKGTYF